jgi:hypothetical protein
MECELEQLRELNTEYAKQWLAESRKLWALIISLGGEARIPEDILVTTDWNKTSLEQYKDPQNGDYMLRILKRTTVG